MSKILILSLKEEILVSQKTDFFFFINIHDELASGASGVDSQIWEEMEKPSQLNLTDGNQVREY